MKEICYDRLNDQIHTDMSLAVGCAGCSTWVKVCYPALCTVKIAWLLDYVEQLFSLSIEPSCWVVHVGEGVLSGIVYCCVCVYSHMISWPLYYVEQLVSISIGPNTLSNRSIDRSNTLPN